MPINEAESGSIYGKVTFSGSWPDTGSVLLTLNNTYPPQGPPAGFEYLSLETILNNEYEYSFNNLSFTNYEAVSVTYWPDDYPNGTYTTLGGHFEDMTVTREFGKDFLINQIKNFDPNSLKEVNCPNPRKIF